MAGNKNAKTPRLSRDRKETTRLKKCDQKWDNIKSEAYRLYILENNNLEATRAAIQETHGFKSSLRRWKTKLSEWDYKKNIKAHDMRDIVAEGAKRALEGKDAIFFHGVTRVTAQRIENFKRRKTGEVPPSVPMPSHIAYNIPPSLSSEEGSQPETYLSSIQQHSPIPQMSSFSIAPAHSAESLCSEIESPLTTKSDPTEALPILILDRYLYNQIQPWSVYHLYHQLGDHDTALAKDRQLFAQVADLLALPEERNPPQNPPLADLSDKQSSSLDLCRMGGQFFEGSYLEMEDEPGDKTSEILDLDDLFGLAVTLAAYQDEHGEFATQTLKQEFELAKVLQRNGNVEEAEYHCRRILDEDHQVNVQAFLGTILANTSRLEESTFWLFSALTGFIIAFDFSSAEANALRFPQIEALFIELNHKIEQDWAALESCICQMMLTIQRAISEGTLGQIFPQLVIYGFSFARECLVLDIINAAKYMYQVLLEHSSHLDVILYGIDKAKAHRDYGLLLRKEGKWTRSAENLRLACEFAVDSRKHDSGLIALLRSEYVALLPHLASEPIGEDSLVERIRKLLIRNNRQTSPHMQEVSKVVQPSRIDDYLSSDLPVQLVTLEPSEVSYVAQFRLPSNPVHGDGDRMSTASSSATASYKYGLLTYPCSEITGISDFISPYL